jgi:hypothetical protein
MTIDRELTEGERQRIHDRREGALWYVAAFTPGTQIRCVAGPDYWPVEA